MFKRLRLFVALLVCALLLTGCGDPTSSPVATSATTTSVGTSTIATGTGTTAAAKATTSAQPVTLRFEGYNYGTPGLGGQGMQMIIDEFQVKYPNIKIEAKNVPSTDILKSVVAQATAGDPPDIAQMTFTSLDYIVANLPAQAINDIAPKEEFDELLSHILPSARKLGIANGKLYGSPFTISTPTLFYNADIFKAAGLDPDKPPTTWEDVRKYSQQIKDKTGKAGVYIAQENTTDWLTQSLISSNGGTTLSADRKKATFNQPEAIEVFSFWQNLVKDGLHPKFSIDDAQAALKGGNLGMLLWTNAVFPSLATAAQGKFDLRTAGEPTFGTKPVVPVNSGSALYVFSKDPAKQRAAWEFLRFAASQRGYTIITSLMGYIPLRDDVLEDPNFLKSFVEKEPRILASVKQISSMQPRVSWPGENSAQAVKIYLQGVLDIIFEGKDAKQTMDALTTRVEELLK
jgi:multiple sugar transport system substrate-binding protein